MAELGQQTVDFSTLVTRAAEESFLALKELVDKNKSNEQSDTEKKIGLLKYICQTQQRMLRLNVLAKWCQQVGCLLPPNSLNCFLIFVSRFMDFSSLVKISSTYTDELNWPRHLIKIYGF